ncbi:MAG: hypothetical protein ACRDRX_02680 [Pseudonocardiaceae bacterium]
MTLDRCPLAAAICAVAARGGPVGSQSPCSLVPASRAYLIGVGWVPWQREAADHQPTRWRACHPERGPRREADPAARHHRAIISQVSVVGVMITQ